MTALSGYALETLSDDAALSFLRAVPETGGSQSGTLLLMTPSAGRIEPEGLARLQHLWALRDRLAEAARQLRGTSSVFSTTASRLALALEDPAGRHEVGQCAEIVERLEAMCSELLEETRG